MNENQIKSRIFVPYLKKAFVGAFIYAPHDTLTAGIPDIIMIYKSRLFVYELKLYRKNNFPRKRQLSVLKMISNAGGNSYIVYLSKDLITDDNMLIKRYKDIIKSIDIKDIMGYQALFLLLYNDVNITL